MSTARTAEIALRPESQRLWVSFGASTALHALALAIFAGLLLPVPAPVWTRLGEPVMVRVLIAPPEVTGPMTPPVQIVATPTPPPVPMPLSPEPLPAAKQTVRIPEPPSRARELEATAAATLSGTPTPNEPTPDAVPDDAPTPPGDVAVGAAEAAEPLGHTQALRLAQRFPQRIARPPRLKSPLIVPYPVRAARSWREARIAALLVVDSDGRVLETSLSPEDPLFAPTVRDALQSASFLPAEADGAPVRYWVVLEFVFTMRQLRQAKPTRS
jgi:outer membrane biosynthesis protein TonB